MARWEMEDKFFEIDLEGTTLTTHWGKVGKAPTNSTKTFPDEAAAQKEREKKIREREKQGYVAVGGGDAKAPAKSAGAKPKAAKASGLAALEKAIEDDPEDEKAYLVYADALQAAGDPRGELIVLQHQNKTKEADALIKEHGFAPPKGSAETLELEWRLGFVKKVTLGWGDYDEDYATEDEGEEDEDEDEEDGETPVVKLVKKDFGALLDHPSCRFVTELHLGPIPGNSDAAGDGDIAMDLGVFVEVLAEKKKPQTLRSLYLGERGVWDISSTATGPIAPLNAFPGLRSVILHGGGSVSIGKGISLPELRELAVRTGGLTKEGLAQICAGKWPTLERLEIWFGDPGYGASGDAGDIAPILAAKGLANVKHLGLMNCAFADDVAAALAKSKILPQLETLDLSMGRLSDAGVDGMVAAKAKFAHLAELNLDDNALTDASKPKVAVLAKKVNFGKEQSPDRLEKKLGSYDRWFVSVGE
jgi:uncharacterized protein (TIGR02996 family)